MIVLKSADVVIKLLLFFIMFCNSSCLKLPSSGNAKIFRNNNLYKCYGIIFDSSYKLEIEVTNLRKRIALNDEDIFLVEKIFVESYTATNQSVKERADALFVNNPKDFFWKYNRQYVGYIDKDGHKNVLLLLFDYANKRKVNKEIGNGWVDNLVIVLADKMPFNVILYRVDLTLKKMYAKW
jgi:hypothetical protein